MNVNPVAATGAETGTKAKLTADFNMFLRLLTTQLQNQDPLNPMKTSEYTQQLVSYSQVEQAIQQTQRLDQILARLSTQDLAAASAYIGRDVAAYQPGAALAGGKAHWFYDLKSNAQTAEVSVRDRNGIVVQRMSGPVTAGRHHIRWNGTDANGKRLPDGIYTLQVIAKTASGQSVASTVGTRGTVTGVESLAGKIILKLGATTVRATDIAEISAPISTPRPAAGAR